MVERPFTLQENAARFEKVEKWGKSIERKTKYEFGSAMRRFGLSLLWRWGLADDLWGYDP